MEIMKTNDPPQKGKKHSEETRRKISDAAKKRFSSPDERKKHSISCAGINKGKKHSEETKEKMSAAQKGQHAGEKCYWYGRQHTDETKEKMSIAQKGKKHSEETKEKISAVQKGHIISDETRRKIGEANLGKTAGEKSHLWKGGVSFEPYCQKFNNAFKESIREKFGRVCFLCPTTEEENGQKLSVHHVDYNKDCLCGDSICEFVPLCVECHSRTNHNREYWENTILTKLGILDG